jgi:N-acetylmuramic acid 6-phosphate etherase
VRKRAARRESGGKKRPPRRPVARKKPENLAGPGHTTEAEPTDKNRETFLELLALITEQRNPRTMDIDTRSTLEIVQAINCEDKTVAAAVERELPQIVSLVELAVRALEKGGRLIYAGAGTSGRLGVLDAAECPPTFGTDPEMIQGVIAGGKRALHRAVEGAEDREEEAVDAIQKLRVSGKDVVVGIAASRRTPFAKAAVAEARKRGAKTGYLTCNPSSTIDFPVDVAICPEVGPEVIMGSTRMKSGTAQKMVLNMITTATMIRMGKVFENMMVDLMATSRKLVERSKRVVMTVTGVDYEAAEKNLKEAGGSVKKALVMIEAQVDAEAADRLLDESSGFVRKALEKAYGPPGGRAGNTGKGKSRCGGKGKPTLARGTRTKRRTRPG